MNRGAQWARAARTSASGMVAVHQRGELALGLEDEQATVPTVGHPDETVTVDEQVVGLRNGLPGWRLRDPVGDLAGPAGVCQVVHPHSRAEVRRKDQPLALERS